MDVRGISDQKTTLFGKLFCHPVMKPVNGKPIILDNPQIYFTNITDTLQHVIQPQVLFVIQRIRQIADHAETVRFGHREKACNTFTPHKQIDRIVVQLRVIQFHVRQVEIMAIGFSAEGDVQLLSYGAVRSVCPNYPIAGERFGCAIGF